MNPLSIQNPLLTLSHLNVAYDMQHHARVLLKGPDAKSFLHRLSTNAVMPSKTGDSCLNALISQKGRLVDLFHQVIVDDQEILAMASPKLGSDFCAWLDQFLFIEKVQLEDISKEGGLVCIFGSKPIADLQKWQCRIEGTQVIMRSFDFIDENLQKIPSFLIYDRKASAQEIVNKLALPPLWIEQDLFETARIAAGICTFPTEINEAFNPLELSLNDALHWDKGCYIGQEVISRLHTYQKLSKQLCLASVNEPDAELLKIGQSIIHSDQTIGQLTSVAPFYWPKHANALAIIKQKSDQEPLPLATMQTDLKQIEVSFAKITP